VTKISISSITKNVLINIAMAQAECAIAEEGLKNMNDCAAKLGKNSQKIIRKLDFFKL